MDIRVEHTKFYSCVFERLHFKWFFQLVMANAENSHLHKQLYKKIVKHSQPNFWEWGFPFGFVAERIPWFLYFPKFVAQRLVIFDPDKLILKNRNVWNVNSEILLTLFTANLAYATNSSFRCGNSGTHFLSLAKVSILIPNLYTTQLRSKLQMIMVSCVACLSEQNTGFIEWILKKKISHLNFVLQLFWYPYCW